MISELRSLAIPKGLSKLLVCNLKQVMTRIDGSAHEKGITITINAMVCERSLSYNSVHFLLYTYNHISITKVVQTKYCRK